MDRGPSLLDSDWWQWIAENTGPFLVIAIVSAAATATAVWLVLWARYHGTIARQRRQIKEFVDKLHGATTDEALVRLESLRARLDRLEPRRLTSRQKAVIRKLLTLPESSGVTEISVAHDAACSDSKQYASDFAHVFDSCPGWRPVRVTTFGSVHGTGSGLAVVCFRQGRTAAGAKLLSKALTEAGIDHETVQGTEEQLELVIAARRAVPEPYADD